MKKVLLIVIAVIAFLFVKDIFTDYVTITPVYNNGNTYLDIKNKNKNTGYVVDFTIKYKYEGEEETKEYKLVKYIKPAEEVKLFGDNHKIAKDSMKVKINSEDSFDKDNATHVKAFKEHVTPESMIKFNWKYENYNLTYTIENNSPLPIELYNIEIAGQVTRNSYFFGVYTDNGVKDQSVRQIIKPGDNYTGHSLDWDMTRVSKVTPSVQWAQ